MSTEQPKRGLFSATANALKWTYGVAVIRSASMMLIGIVLARLLGPAPFGLVAVAGIVIGFSNLIADFGFGAALVQTKEASPEDIRFVFTWQMLIALLLAALVVGSAPLIALAFKQPDVAPIVRVLSLSFVINAFGQTSASLLRREMAFKRVQLVLAASFVVGEGLVGVTLAFLGLGVWALVFAQLIQSLIYSSAVYLSVRHSLRPLVHLPGRAKELLGFGGNVVATNVVNSSINNLDSAFVGRFFGAVGLGLYNRAYSLMTSTMGVVIVSLQNVLFPAYSRAQDDHEKLARFYLASLSLVSLIMFPVFTSVALAAPTVIYALYGKAWLGAAPLLTPLALAMPVHALLALSGPLLWAVGKVNLELRLEIVTAIFMFIALLIASNISLTAVAWSVLITYVLRCVLFVGVTFRFLKLGLPKVLQSLKGAALLTLVTTSGVWLVERALLQTSLSVYLRLTTDIACGALIILVTLLLAHKAILGADIRWLLTQFGNRLPSFLRLSLDLDPGKVTSH